jgi:hypothetical protein
VKRIGLSQKVVNNHSTSKTTNVTQIKLIHFFTVIFDSHDEFMYAELGSLFSSTASFVSESINQIISTQELTNTCRDLCESRSSCDAIDDNETSHLLDPSCAASSVIVQSDNQDPEMNSESDSITWFHPQSHHDKLD